MAESNRKAREHLELRGWKAIAEHLGCHYDTAMKYADELGMPVRKLGEAKSSAVLAYRDEVDEWWEKKFMRPRAPAKCRVA